MNNLEKYNSAFVNAFGVTQQQLPDLTFQSVSQWDSIGHMQLIATLEESFNILLETEDIIDFSSYKKGKELMTKYGISL
jgi:acyl carrier protein